jgi:hypothetical protein
VKLIKTANKNKFILRISKIEWEKIGIDNNWIEIESATQWQIPLREFEKRLNAIGWNLSRKGKGGGVADYMAFAPDGKTKLTISAHNWDSTWKRCKQELLSQNRDLDFIFMPVFNIPTDFNMLYQKTIKPIPQFDIKIISVKEQLPKDLYNYDVLINGQWIRPIEIDWISYVFLDKNENIYSLPDKSIQIRKQKS